MGSHSWLTPRRLRDHRAAGRMWARCLAQYAASRALTGIPFCRVRITSVLGSRLTLFDSRVHTVARGADVTQPSRAKGLSGASVLAVLLASSASLVELPAARPAS